jgi:hypothetical protein
MIKPEKPQSDRQGLPRLELLACRVFEREIALHAAAAKHIVEIRFFEVGLQDRPDELRATLQEALSEVERMDDIQAVVIAYGLCSRGTARLQPLRHKLVIPRAPNEAIFRSERAETKTLEP